MGERHVTIGDVVAETYQLHNSLHWTADLDGTTMIGTVMFDDVLLTLAAQCTAGAAI